MKPVIRAVNAAIICAMSVSVSAQSEAVGRTRTGSFRVHDLTVRVTLTSEERTSVSITEPSGSSFPLVLPKRFDRVDGVAASQDRGRLAILGQSEGTDVIVVVDRLKRQIVSDLPAFGASVSPNGHLLVFERFHGRMETDFSAQYTSVDLDSFQGGGSLRQPLPAFFPKGVGGKHQRISDLQWIDDNTVAFVDLSGDKASIVAARFAPGGAASRLDSRELPTESLVIATKVDGDGPPASALYGATITQVPESGLVLRLAFRDDTALKAKRLDIRLWNGE